MCGVAIRLGSPISGEFFGGSWAKVSTAAPASWPERKPSANAASSISSPRAQLISRAPRFIHHVARGAIDHPPPAFHLRDRGRIDHFVGRRAERGVQRYQVGIPQQLFERHELDVEFARYRLRDVRIRS